ncbi:MAG: ATP-binding protein [Cyanobacteria bacterium P01_F01_bin.53]
MIDSDAQQLLLDARSDELRRIKEAINQDRDLVVIGVTGSGRGELVEISAQEAEAMTLKIDCIKAVSLKSFLILFLKELLTENSRNERLKKWFRLQDKDSFLSFLQKRDIEKFLILDSIRPLEDCGVTTSEEDKGKVSLKQTLEELIDLLEDFLTSKHIRVVVFLKNFTHLFSWDRDNKFSEFLLSKIHLCPHISYALIATYGEWESKELNHLKKDELDIEPIQLPYISRGSLRSWARAELHANRIDSDDNGLDVFVDAVQGHFGDALALVRRLQSLHAWDEKYKSAIKINDFHVEKAVNDLLKDLSVVFETLLLLLPATQVKLLESLAINPTKSPHSKKYAEAHGLPRGGGIQNALEGLKKKGLIYPQEYEYRLALPTLAQWIKQSLEAG